MAKQNKAKNDLGELIRRSDAARASLTQTGANLKEKLNFAGKAKDAVRKKPAQAIGGSLVAGYILKKILFRKKKSSPKKLIGSGKLSHFKKDRSFLLTLLLFLGKAAKPAAKIYATKLLKDYLKGRLLVGSESRPRATPLRHY